MVKQCYYQNVLYAVVKNQDLSKKNEASELLSSLGIKAPLSKIQILDKILL